MSDSAPDMQAFRHFEEAGWASADIAGHYTDWLSPLTSQSVASILDVLQLGIAHSLLDLACGPGVLADAAAERGGLVAGMDFSPSMVAIAHKRYPDLEFYCGDAEQMPFRAASFDTIAMNYGMLHLAHPEAALREAFRVVKPGGSFAFTVWSVPQQAVGFQIILDAVAAHGTPNPALPPGPPFFRFSDPSESERALTEAGFVDPRVHLVPQTWQLPSAGAFLQAMAEGTVRTRALLSAQDATSMAAISAHVEDALRPYQTSDGIELPMPAVLAWGLKP